MRVTQFLTLALLGAASSVASAGELGPTSRETISISITIPPHVMVKPAKSGTDGAVSAGAWCVSSNGVAHYHVALLSHDGTQVGTMPSGLPLPRQAGCGPAARELVPVSVQFSNAADGKELPGEPAMLLIVPE
jgi:hypothetical protein